MTNRKRQTLAGTLKLRLPRRWRLRIHDPWAGPEEGWIEARNGHLAFQLQPGESKNRLVRFCLPANAQQVEYRIELHAVAADGPSVGLARTFVGLDGRGQRSLPWLTRETAAALRACLHAGESFCFSHDGREIGRSAPGLVGMLDSRVQFLGREALGRYIGQRDFIKHALILIGDDPVAAPLREELECLLDEGIDPHEADERARVLLETAVQQTRDLSAVRRAAA